LGGFEIVGAADDCTYLAGRAEGSGHLYDVLAVIGASNIELVSLKPITDGLE
jgi:hypothetical protein